MPVLAAYSKKISPKRNNVSEKQGNKNSDKAAVNNELLVGFNVP